ncbi:hypothetical protein BBK82_23280 [Lentzea guizhouensis]|uniref:Uncharacterized protein n=2 Tax=Lentzea guizhouensis TaxID=1586287 RepID=A0A1B2HLF2_9PSEU|nr:hypothetical protein BBK82_23280 [Lentzea guizhouensis]
MLIWTPLNAAELQKAMHGANIGPAALVPVHSGTVLLPSLDIKLAEAVLMAARVRKVADRAALFVWNESAAACYPFTAATPIGRGWFWGGHDEVVGMLAAAKRSSAVGRAADRAFSGLLDQRGKEKARLAAAERTAALTGADVTEVLHALGDHRNGVDAVPRFLREFGLPEVALVAELADEGRADAWITPLAPPRTPSWPKALIPPIWLALLAGLLAFGLPWWVFALAFGGSVVVIYAALASAANQLVRRKPVNTALPVVPVTQGAAPTD